MLYTPVPKVIDIDKEEIQSLTAVEGDIKTRVYYLRLRYQGTVLDLTDCKVSIYAVNSLVNTIWNTLEIINAKQGLIKWELTDKFMVAGTTKYQFIINTADGGTLTSLEYNLFITKSLFDSKAIESSNEFGTLKEMLKDVTNIQININKANTNAQNALDTANLNKEEISNVEKNLSSSINKNTKDIKSLKQVKGIPYNELICFIPTKTQRYLESFEVIEDKGEMIAGYTNMDESINKIAELQKFNLYTKESKSYKEIDGLGHCNDLAYIPKTGELLVATITGTYPNQLMVLDYDTLEFKRWQSINGGSMTDTITGVAYNKDKDMVIIKAGDPNIKLLDSSFNITKEITIPQGSLTFQTICSGGDYIYFNANYSDGVSNIIKVYNLETEEIEEYNYNYKGEPEGSAVLNNGNVLLTFNTPGKWHFDTPRIFEIDFTKRSTSGNLNSCYGADGRRITECKQFMYFAHHGSNWDLILDESNAGNNLYSSAGNNFFGTVKNGTSLDIKLRSSILYEQDGGLILNCMCIPNYTAKSNGIDIICTYDKSKHIEMDFFKNGSHIDESEVPENCGFRLYINVGVHALS